MLCYFWLIFSELLYHLAISCDLSICLLFFSYFLLIFSEILYQFVIDNDLWTSFRYFRLIWMKYHIFLPHKSWIWVIMENPYTKATCLPQIAFGGHQPLYNRVEMNRRINHWMMDTFIERKLNWSGGNPLLARSIHETNDCK